MRNYLIVRPKSFLSFQPVSAGSNNDIRIKLKFEERYSVYPGPASILWKYCDALSDGFWIYRENGLTKVRLSKGGIVKEVETPSQDLEILIRNRQTLSVNGAETDISELGNIALSDYAFGIPEAFGYRCNAEVIYYDLRVWAGIIDVEEQLIFQLDWDGIEYPYDRVTGCEGILKAGNIRPFSKVVRVSKQTLKKTIVKGG